LGLVGGSYQADFLVDTGATDSLAPAAELRKIGVQPVGKMVYELADGTLHEYEFGLAQFEFMGEITAGRVIFGPDDAEPILGVTVLESVGITIDPATRTLKRLPAIPLK
jgi:clan AA aspartic protease